MFNRRKQEQIKDEFEENILEHIDSLYNTAFVMTHDKHNAEDLVQETALKAYRFFHRFKRGTNFKAWIVTILRNTYINSYRKKIKEPVSVEFDMVENFIGLSEPKDFKEEIFSESLKASIDRLPEELRSTLSLFYVDGFSYKEISKILNVPVGTVMSRLYTARQILKKQLTGAMEKEGL